MYTMESRVGASMTDAHGRMRLTAALDVMQDCSQLWMESEPAFTAFLDERGLGMFILSRQADIVRLPHYGERVRAATSIYECKGFYGYRNTVLYGEDGAPCVLSWSIGGFVGYETGRPVRITPEVAARITHDPKLEMDYLDKRIPWPDGDPQRLPPAPVRRADVDMNRHVNNVRYIERAFELLPADFAVARLRVEYRHAATASDTLHPLLFTLADERRVVALTDGGERVFCVVEFTP